MALTEITLHVDGSGNFKVTPDPLNMFKKTKDTVKVAATKNRKFKIVFHGQSPLAQKIWDQNKTSQLARGVISGVYPYALAILDSDTGEIFIKADCPSIIVH